MTKTALICVVLAAAARAQDPAPADDAISWASGLRESMRRMTNPVVAAYGIASLAAVVCAADKGVGGDLFREALADLNNLPGSVFQDSDKRLPVATFSGLWKLVVGPGMKCDPRLPPPGDRARERRDAERRQAASYLAQAKFTADYDRAAQLAEAALEAGDPYQLDPSSITSFLIQFRVPVPDLADEVFQRAIAFTTSGEVTSIPVLTELGNYLFVGVGLQGRSEPMLNRVTYTVNGSRFVSWAGDHENTNPDMVAAYIGAVADTLTKQEIASQDLVAAYAAVYQLLPKAKDLGLSEADTLQKALDQMLSQNAAVVALVEGKLSDGISSGAGQSTFAKLIAQIRAALAAGRFAEARELLPSIDGVALRSQIATLVDFHEAAYALRGKDSERALALAGALPSGVKRSLVYAGIVATSENRLVALPALHAGLKDAELLSYEQRMAMLPALATACSRTDSDETQAVVSQLIEAYNGAAIAPHKVRFDPKSSGTFDGQRVLFGSGGFLEVAQGSQGRQNFTLKVTGVTAFSLEAFIAQAKHSDFLRLVATVEELHNDVQLAKAYVALAGLRLKKEKH